MGSQKVLYVGIGGKKRHGKDTFADALANELRINGRGIWPVKRAFADSLREEVATFIGPRFTDCPGWPNDGLNCVGLLKDCLRSDVPAEKEPFRLLMQWWGTEFRRGMFGEGYWLKRHQEWLQLYLYYCNEEDKVVLLIPDMRFPNEFDYVRTQGGITVKIERSESNNLDSHASETLLEGLVGWDAIISNDRSKEELRQTASLFCKEQLMPRLQEMQPNG